jgi:hypothetical protein
MPSIFIRDKLIFSSERVSHKDYYRRSSVEKKSGRGFQGAWRQDELIGGKPPVLSNLRLLTLTLVSMESRTKEWEYNKVETELRNYVE